MQRILSFDQTPPLSGPLRFFLSAPLFSFACGALLLWAGPQVLVSRWIPATLGLTHLITLGFLAMAMLGALIQILPVVAGILIPRAQLTACAVHALLTAGTILLATAFWMSAPFLFKPAIVLLGLAFSWLLGALVIGYWRAGRPAATDTVRAMRLGVVALLVTVVLGLMLGSAFAWPLSLPLILLTNLHVLWGLAGWVGLLTIGVAFQVVPMFLVTPTYPRLVSQRLAGAIFLLLVLRSIAEVVLQGRSHWIADVMSVLIALGLLVFAGVTLYLLWRRKRPVADATTLFWRMAMASLAVCALLSVATPQLAPLLPPNSMPLLLGLLFMVGFAYSAINGMLYKIVPFLIWYHLQSTLDGGCAKVPSAKKILPEQDALRQFRCHLLTLPLLLAAALWPAAFTHLAGVALCVSSAWLARNLWQAARVYRQVRDSA